MREMSKEKMAVEETVPTYGILLINRQYNEGKLTFDEWREQSREWSLAMIRQYGTAEDKKRWSVETEKEGAA